VKTGKRQPLTIDALEAWLIAEGISIRFNEITHEVIIDGVTENIDSSGIDENIPTIIYDRIKSQWKTNRSEVLDYIKVIYMKNKFNPFAVFLAQQDPWDG